MMVSYIARRIHRTRSPKAARSSFWMPPSLLGYDDAAGPPFLGNQARHSAMWLLAHEAAVLQSGPEKS